MTCARPSTWTWSSPLFDFSVASRACGEGSVEPVLLLNEARETLARTDPVVLIAWRTSAGFRRFVNRAVHGGRIILEYVHNPSPMLVVDILAAGTSSPSIGDRVGTNHP